MKHAGCVYAQEMVIALIIILLTSNFLFTVKKVACSYICGEQFLSPPSQELVQHEQQLLGSLQLLSAAEHKVFVCVFA